MLLAISRNADDFVFQSLGSEAAQERAQAAFTPSSSESAELETRWDVYVGVKKVIRGA